MTSFFTLNLAPLEEKLPFFSYDDFVLQQAKQRLEIIIKEFNQACTSANVQLSQEDIIHVLAYLQPEELVILNTRAEFYKAILHHEDNAFASEQKDFLELMLLAVKLKKVNVEIQRKILTPHPFAAEIDQKYLPIVAQLKNTGTTSEYDYLISHLTIATAEYKDSLEQDTRRILDKIALPLEQLAVEMAKPLTQRHPQLQKIFASSTKKKLTLEKYLLVKDCHDILQSKLPGEEKIAKYCQKIAAYKELLETQRDSASLRFVAKVGRMALLTIVILLATPVAIIALLPISFINDFADSSKQLQASVEKSRSAENKIANKEGDFFSRPHTKGHYLVAQQEKLFIPRKKSR